MMKTLKWIGINGNEIELRTECKITMKNEVIYCGGRPYEFGSKVKIAEGILELWVDGNKVAECTDVNRWIISDLTQGQKRISGLPVAMTDEQAEIVKKFLDEVIEEGKSEEVKAIEAAEAEAKKAERIAEAKKIIEDAAKYAEPLMTYEEYKKWRKRYNYINNEGGEGYIPELITVEKLEWAKSVLANKNK